MAERPAWDTPIILEVLRDFPPADSGRVYGGDFIIGLVYIDWGRHRREMGIADQDTRAVDWRYFLETEHPDMLKDSTDWYLSEEADAAGLPMRNAPEIPGENGGAES